MKRFILFATVALAAFAGCRKNEAETVTETKHGTVTEKGKPLGQAVTKTIGAGGGTIASADNKLTISVPAGALTANTEISVQPIENFAPNGNGLAYRLLPEGTRFNQSVTLSFAYNDSLADGTPPDYLSIAYQGSNNVWKAQEAQVNKAQKTVTVTTKHFSDWTMFSYFRIVAVKKALELSQSTSVVVYETHFDVVDSFGKEFENVTRKVDRWQLSGEGQLSGNESKATYTAPDHVPTPNPVVVCAEINNLTTDYGPRGKVLLLAPITILGEYVNMKFGGVDYWFTTANTQLGGGFLMITAAEGGAGVHMNITGMAPGYYPVVHNGNGTALVVIQGTQVYEDMWVDCNSATPHYVDAAVTLTKVGKTGEFIDGVFSGQVTADFGCSHDTRTVSGTFHVKRRF